MLVSKCGCNSAWSSDGSSPCEAWAVAAGGRQVKVPSRRNGNANDGVDIGPMQSCRKGFGASAPWATAAGCSACNTVDTENSVLPVAMTTSLCISKQQCEATHAVYQGKAPQGTAAAEDSPAFGSCLPFPQGVQHIQQRLLMIQEIPTRLQELSEALLAGFLVWQQRSQGKQG